MHGFQLPIEKVQRFALKRFLGVDQRAPNDMVLGDRGRYPLEINCYMRALRYWLRIMSMNIDRLPRKAYNMLVKLDEKDKKNVQLKSGCSCSLTHFGFV